MDSDNVRYNQDPSQRRFSLQDNELEDYLEILPPDAEVYDHMRPERPYMRMQRVEHKTRSLDLYPFYSSDSLVDSKEIGIDENYYDQIIYEEVQTVKNDQPSKRIIKYLICVIVGLCILIGVMLWIMFGKLSSLSNSVLDFQNQTTQTIVYTNPEFITPIPTFENSSLATKREFIRNMTLESWNAYVRYAWGEDALAPVSSSAVGPQTGGTLVSAMSTLYVMELRQEFDLARQWIQSKWNLASLDKDVLAYISVTYFLASFLSCYALTGDQLFREKATEMIHLLSSARNNKTGLFYYQYNPKTKLVRYSNNLIYATGVQQPELIYFAHLQNDTELASQMSKIKQLMRQIDKPRGLYMKEINVNTGKWANSKLNQLDIGIQLYQNFAMAYIQSNKQDLDSLNMFVEAFNAIEANGMLSRSDNGFLYAGKLNLTQNVTHESMSDNGCRLGAMLTMAASMFPVNSSMYQHYLELAINITETCHHVADQTATKLLPWEFSFTKYGITVIDQFASIGNDLAQNYYALWRATGDSKYRKYAWQLATAIFNHCRTGTGYSNLLDVNKVPANSSKSNYQPSTFLSSTLKFLYLIFAEDDPLPEEKWFFNATGHPLPISGKHSAYPAIVSAC